jgi:hypothetical protein
VSAPRTIGHAAQCAAWARVWRLLLVDDEPLYEEHTFDDGTVRVRGVQPHVRRESLLMTHVEGGRDPEGRVIWYPKATGDDA